MFRVTFTSGSESLVDSHKDAHKIVTARTDALGFAVVKYDGTRASGAYLAGPTLDGPWSMIATVIETAGAR